MAGDMVCLSLHVCFFRPMRNKKEGNESEQAERQSAPLSVDATQRFWRTKEEQEHKKKRTEEMPKRLGSTSFLSCSFFLSLFIFSLSFHSFAHSPSFLIPFSLSSSPLPLPLSPPS
jgi:hypothetical protein